MVALFFIIPAIILILAAIYFYIFYRRILTIFLKNKNYRMIGSLLLTLITIRIAWPVYDLGGVVVFHILFLSLIFDLFCFLWKKWKGNLGKNSKFLHESGLLVFLVTTLIFGYGYMNIHHVKKTTYIVRTKKMKQGKDLKIALISDLHLGATMNANHLEQYMKKIQKQKPDLLLLAGDIFDENTKKSEMKKAAQIFGSFSSTYGTFYVYGNHDSNLYTKKPYYTAAQLRKTLEISHVHVLEDQQIHLTKHLILIGRKDASDINRKSLQQILPYDHGKAFCIVMDHQPIALKEISNQKVDLQVSGHTHAGQIWPTGQLMQFMGISDLNYGEKTMKNSRLIVTSGIGGWGYPIRTGGHCEYVMIHILGCKK